MPQRFALAIGLIGLIGSPLDASAPDEPAKHQDSPKQDDLAGELPRILPLEPADAAKTFQIHEGFRLAPVAVEPLVTDPVEVCYDADGRLYVVEMRGYPYPETVATGKVRRLEDHEGDGTFDSGTTFLDGLSWPTSVVPYRDGVFVAVPPEIVFARDTDGDGVADETKVMFSGFGTQNVQGLVNGLRWGTDGWIYGVSGGNGGVIRNETHPDRSPVELQRRDFRFLPDGSAFEAVSGGGQFGHAFDDWGRRFTCNNSNHIRQIVIPAEAVDRNPSYAPATVIADIPVEGPAAPVFRISRPEPWRLVRTRRRAADPEYVKRLPPSELVPTGFFTSATGVTIYRGTAYPAEFRGNAFIGDVGGNLVHRKTLSASGSILKATRADEGIEFLASTDNWFRPVNFTNTPRGTLLILDMYRETIEHPLSIPDDIKAHLDLTSGHDRGRIYELRHLQSPTRSQQPRLSAATTEELVAHLAHPDSWWRETAQRILLERGDPQTPELLRRLLAEARDENALATVHALWTLDALNEIQSVDLLPAFHHPEPGVRENAVRIAAGRGDSALDEAIIEAAGDPTETVRFQVAIALGTLSTPEATSALSELALRKPVDSWLRSAILCSAAEHAVGMLQRILEEPGEVDTTNLAWIEPLSAIIASRNRPGEVRSVVATVAKESHPRIALSLLVGLADALRRSGSSLDSALGAESRPLVASWVDQAAAIVATSEAEPESRALAVRLIGHGDAEKMLVVLPGLLDAREPVPLQLAVVKALGACNDPKIGPAILDRWSSLSPAVRGEAIEILLGRPDRVLCLLKAVRDQTISAAEIDPARKAQILNIENVQIRELARSLFGETVRVDRTPILVRFATALKTTGDTERGREVFEAVCSTCHRAEGRGIEVGPDLETIAGRTAEDLLVHILDPNREVQPAFLIYNVALRDGRVISGVIAAESAATLTLKRAQGLVDVVPRDQIEAMVSSGLSLMPENLETQLDPSRMADLLAYLKHLQASQPSPR